MFEYHRTCSSISTIFRPILSFCSVWCATSPLRLTIATPKSSASNRSSKSCSECSSDVAPSMDSDQLALGPEDIDSDIARIEEEQPKGIPEATATQPRRRALPDHLPREDVRLDVESKVCSCCGGALHLVGESVSEMLDWVPAQLRVVRITRPKYACRACNKVMQAAAPDGDYLVEPNQRCRAPNMRWFDIISLIEHFAPHASSIHLVASPARPFGMARYRVGPIRSRDRACRNR